MRPGPGRIVALVIALLFVVALLPKACAQVMLPHRHSTGVPIDPCFKQGYLVYQQFEGTGYDHCETWTNAAVGMTVDPDYSPALDGAQSLYCLGQDLANYAAINSFSFADQDEVYGYCMLNYVYKAAGIQRVFFELLNSSTVVADLRLSATPMTALVTTGPVSVDTISSYATNTVYHVWMHYRKSTGANGIVSVEFNTNNVQHASGSRYAEILTHTDTRAINKMSVGEFSNEAETVIMDDVILSPTPITPITAIDYIASTAVFDGSNDYMGLTSSGPTGLADSKEFTISFWVRFDGGDGTQQFLLSEQTSDPFNRIYFRKTTTDTLQFLFYNSASTEIMNLVTDGTLTAASGWTHVYACFDLTDTGKRKVYFNGTPQTLTVTTYSNDTIDYVSVNATYTIGAYGGTFAGKLNGALSEYWWNDAYLDDPTKFASGGSPIYLGADGSIPTGSRPVFYFKGDGNGFNANSGTGGNFTITGSLGTTTPP